MKIKIAIFLILPLLLLTVFSTSALAVGKPEGVGTSQTGAARSCQARENAIKNRSVYLTKLATTMETKFDAIASRVEDYYTLKVVPSGKTVANYNALISDIQIKKAAVSTALAKAQTDASNFSCTSSDPKTQMTQFREDMQAVKSALKDYRTSIKNLIVAIRSVTGADNSESPKPTK